ncbi:hypothetical protein BO82DRAFT_416105 [Aspergillus uvarum CBS 121591]|uniref:Uncharacterized protein n=1 Tax=Aspergillus uvarum CBS 121591 TaxID=1448315 RepID=A0A319CC93_9EURO|nr:hypothetical protein BO82DRAFT_416105 [Aspergillus uvarum CBS 121591]PYH81371.1 hypothetical protein BO82DRAFT_416105 [Aspergillus uvarum CBS 121591]
MSQSVPIHDAGIDATLQGSLAGLSLTDHETGNTGKKFTPLNPFEDLTGTSKWNNPVRKDGCGINPFELFLPQSVASERDSVQSVANLVRDVIPEHLSGLREPRRFTLHETDELYIQGQSFKRKWEISEASFLNWKRLLSGLIDFPVLLLLNPSNWDYLPFEEMVDNSTTLCWLEGTFAGEGLGLDDVIICDSFPMITDDLLMHVNEHMEPAKLEELRRESFALTKASLALIKPRILLSCQCCTKPENEKWGAFKDTLAQRLCSSVVSFREGRVQVVDIDGHRMQVVRGVHPQYVVQYDFALEERLAGLFARVFGPFGTWYSRRVATQQALRDAITVTQGLVASLRLQIRLHANLRQQAAEDGLEEPVAAELGVELKALLEECKGNHLIDVSFGGIKESVL